MRLIIGPLLVFVVVVIKLPKTDGFNTEIITKGYNSTTNNDSITDST